MDREIARLAQQAVQTGADPPFLIMRQNRDENLRHLIILRNRPDGDVELALQPVHANVVFGPVHLGKAGPVVPVPS